MNAIDGIVTTSTSAGFMAEMTQYKSKCIDPRAWAVTWDESIAARVDESEYYWAPIEINSPIFTFSEQGSEKAFQEIKLVCQTLKTNFKRM